MAHLATEVLKDALGNVTTQIDYGTVDGGPGIAQDSPITRTFAFQLPPGDASAWNWQLSDAYLGDRHAHYEFDSAGHVVKAYGDLKGTLPLLRFHEDASQDVAPTPADASHDGTNILRSEMSYDSFGNVRSVKGPGGRCTMMTYDPNFNQLEVSHTTYTNGCSGSSMTTSTMYDRGLEVITSVTGPTGAVAMAEFDGFGRPLREFAPSLSTPGLSDTVPSAKFTYTDPDGGPYRKVQVERRDDAGSSAHYQSTWTYIDPFGHTVASIQQADPGDPAPYIVSGQATRNSYGHIRTQYDPYFATVDPAGPMPPAVPAGTPGRSMDYDGFERPFQVYGLDGKVNTQIRYHALSTVTFDAADLAEGATQRPMTTVRDGHGRTILKRRTTNQGGASDTISTVMSYLSTGEIQTVMRSHTASTDVYTRNMTYDSFGRLVQNAEPNTSKDFGTGSMKTWRYAYNDADDLVGTSDARGCGRNSRFDGAGRLMAQTYSPCLKTHTKYVDRPAAAWIYDAPEANQGGDAASYAGKLAAVYDRAQHAQFVYDRRGRTTRARKQIAVPNSEHDPVTMYAEPWFEKGFSFDEANRVLGESTGATIDALLGTNVKVGTLEGKSVVTTAYTARGLTARIGGSYGDLVKGTLADADGRITSQAFADAAGTTATYSYNTKRLLQKARIARPSQAPTVLQDVRMDSYDPVNNPLLIGDARIADEWPDGAKPVTRSLQYDDLSQLRRVDYAFPTTSGSDKQVSAFDAEAKKKDGTPVPEQAIENRVKWQAFDYDWQGSLRSSDDDAHAFFDRSMGSATLGSATLGPNRVVSAALGEGKADAVYDAAGNLTRMLVKKKDGHSNVSLLFVYDWDEVGNLARARRLSKDQIPNIDALGAQVLQMDLSRVNGASADLSYTYDAGGQRVIKTHENPSTRAKRYSIEVFGTLRLNRAQFDREEYGRTDETEVPYLASNGSALGRVVYNVDLPRGPDGSARHVFLEMTDPLGSTSVVIDKATGQLVERATYLAYGQAESDYRPESWESFREDYRFTGKEDDVGVGLSYFGARYYVPALGQWASADPLTIHGLGSDLNPYAFVMGSPQRYIDPNGLDICEVCWIANSGWQGGGLWGWDPFGSPVHDALTPFWNRVGSAGGPKYPDIVPQNPAIKSFGGYWDYQQTSTKEPPPPEYAFAADTVVILVKTIWVTQRLKYTGLISYIKNRYDYVTDPDVSQYEREARQHELMLQIVSPAPNPATGFGAGTALALEGGGAEIAATAGEAGLEIPGLMMGAAKGKGSEGYREKTRGANASDGRMIRDAAREVGVDARGFGDYVESTKFSSGRDPSVNYTYRELLDLAREFKDLGGNP